MERKLNNKPGIVDIDFAEKTLSFGFDHCPKMGLILIPLNLALFEFPLLHQ